MIGNISKIKAGWVALGLLIAATLVAGLAGCSSDGSIDEEGLSGSINIIGSNTVTPLSSVWAEEFMRMNKNVGIAVSGPGSGAGIAALINGTTDICQASRKIKDAEVESARKNSIEPYEIQVATDALSVVVNPANPVSELTFAQLSAIYSGKITNWKELGGNDAPVVTIARDTNSGTHVFFKEHVVQMEGLPAQDKSLEYGSKVLLLPSTEEGVSEVTRNPNAIFYAGLGYVTDKVKSVAIKTTAADRAVLPSLETALDGSYPVSRPLLYYTNGIPEGTIKAFIDYCLSDEGQEKVIEVDYVPLR